MQINDAKCTKKIHTGRCTKQILGTFFKINKLFLPPPVCTNEIKEGAPQFNNEQIFCAAAYNLISSHFFLLAVQRKPDTFND